MPLSTDVDFRGEHSRLAKWIAYESPLESAYGRFVVDALAASSSNWVLDDGCGNGRFSIILAHAGCQVVALDLNQFLLKKTKASTEHDSVYVVRGDMTHLPLRTSFFDRVLCVHNLWYVKHFREAVYEIERVLNVGGKCVADQLNLLDAANFVDWKFYGMLLKSLLAGAFIDLGRTCSSFLEPFVDMGHVLFSVTENGDVKKGYHVFANRFLIVATKGRTCGICNKRDVGGGRNSSLSTIPSRSQTKSSKECRRNCAKLWPLVSFLNERCKDLLRRGYGSSTKNFYFLTQECIRTRREIFVNTKQISEECSSYAIKILRGIKHAVQDDSRLQSA
jgi:SAM-dependent methyltransferase